MSLFTSKRADFPLPPVPAYPGQSLFGGSGPQTVDSAMRISAVWACVRMLSDAVSMMPLEAFGVDKDGARRPIKPGPLLTKPSSDATLPEWVQMLLTSLLLRGNAYGVHVERDGNGFPTQTELLHPDQVQVHVDRDTGRLTYTAGGQPLATEDVLHVRGLRLPGVPLGLSPIDYAAKTLATEQAAAAFGRGFFLDGAHPSAVLTTDQQVGQDKAQEVKDRFKAAIKGRDVAVLGAGVKYTAIQVNPEESQFLETQKFSISQIARIFGVPPEMIGGDSGGSMTYSNVTQRSLDFLTYAVQPWLTRIENAIFPLIPGARHVRFNTSALVRMTPIDRWNVAKNRLLLGAATINEVRAEEGQAAVEWGDEPYLPAFSSSSALAVTQDEIANPDDKGDTV